MDRTGKLLLAAIALGLFLNAGVQLIPTPAGAQGETRSAAALEAIAETLASISDGGCENKRLC